MASLIWSRLAAMASPSASMPPAMPANLSTSASWSGPGSLTPSGMAGGVEKPKQSLMSRNFWSVGARAPAPEGADFLPDDSWKQREKPSRSRTRSVSCLST